MDIRDRIQSLERVSGRSISEHPDQYRFHPRAERDAFRGVVEAIGVADAILAYHSERDGGALTLINGHMRVSEFPDVEWPVLVTDLDDDEADLMLATMDAMSAMGEIGDSEKHAALVGRLKAEAPALKAMLVRARSEGKIAELLAKARGELDHPLNEDGGGDDGRGPRLASGAVRVRPVVWIDDLALFEQALRKTRIPNRGEAMAEVCRGYLAHVESETARP